MGTEPQDLQHRGVKPVKRPVAASGEHGIIGTLAAQRSVGELRREGRVPAGDAPVGEQPRQQQVGVRVPVGDRLEHVVGGATGGVAAVAGSLAAPRSPVIGGA
jgi:hypothetical protein